MPRILARRQSFRHGHRELDRDRATRARAGALWAHGPSSTPTLPPASDRRDRIRTARRPSAASGDPNSALWIRGDLAYREGVLQYHVAFHLLRGAERVVIAAVLDVPPIG